MVVAVTDGRIQHNAAKQLKRIAGLPQLGTQLQIASAGVVTVARRRQPQGSGGTDAMQHGVSRFRISVKPSDSQGRDVVGRHHGVRRHVQPQLPRQGERGGFGHHRVGALAGQ
jgi:hypothetical protein